MSHLRLVPPLPAEPVSDEAAVPAPRSPYDAENVALAFFQSASGICLCRECTKARHPAFAAR
jgi:hypothetical protein